MTIINFDTTKFEQTLKQLKIAAGATERAFVEFIRSGHILWYKQLKESGLLSPCRYQ